ncbi:alpha-1,3/1,6-mannosyltransferase ALG2-like [Carassius auratus]|uniref:Alpha-1,3/1,6-mannosyltransferase ALG2-like n=1 Tax=Carassius auratus TaxID=7957 RepID=A0A6P6LI34_CARAU|nr:alpha-1,3/1,6-mannosyltransferase ALG2-like [Carassius auratus]
MADRILVNSQFTAGVFKQTFPKLAEIQTDILYPSLNSSVFNVEVEGLSGLLPEGRSLIFLSINGYERKKNLPLALQALAALKEHLSAGEWEHVHLVMAVGYDERVVENVEHYEELHLLATSLGLDDHITFLRSFSHKQKLSLLYSSTCVQYCTLQAMNILALYPLRPCTPIGQLLLLTQVDR